MGVDRGTKAQSALEYSIFVAAISAALISMQVYFSRSLQGKHKQKVDSFTVVQFSPHYSNYAAISETLPYEIESEVSPQGASKVKNKTNQVTRVLAGKIEAKNLLIDSAKFFDSDNSLELNEKFKFTSIETDYSLDEGSLTSVKDDFSEKRLAEDKIFK